jgi:hypothetical protein
MGFLGDKLGTLIKIQLSLSFSLFKKVFILFVLFEDVIESWLG